MNEHFKAWPKTKVKRHHSPSNCTWWFPWQRGRRGLSSWPSSPDADIDVRWPAERKRGHLPARDEERRGAPRKCRPPRSTSGRAESCSRTANCQMGRKRWFTKPEHCWHYSPPPFQQRNQASHFPMSLSCKSSRLGKKPACEASRVNDAKAWHFWPKRSINYWQQFKTESKTETCNYQIVKNVIDDDLISSTAQVSLLLH